MNVQRIPGTMVAAPIANPQNSPSTNSVEKSIPNTDAKSAAAQKAPVASRETFNMKTAYDFINAIRSTFQAPDLENVREFIHDFFVSKQPPKSISRSAIEQGLVLGHPVCIDGEHTDDFLSRLIDAMVLEKKDEHVDDVFFNTTLSSCAKYVSENLLNAEVNQSTSIGNQQTTVDIRHTSESAANDVLQPTSVSTIYSNPTELSFSKPQHKDYVDSLISPTGKSALLKIADEVYISDIEKNPLKSLSKLLHLTNCSIHWAWNDKSDQFAALVCSNEQKRLKLYVFTHDGTQYQKNVTELDNDDIIDNFEINYITDIHFLNNHLCINYEQKGFDRCHRMLLLKNKSGAWQVKANLPFIEDSKQESDIKKIANAISFSLTKNTIECLLLSSEINRIDSYHFDENQQLMAQQKILTSKPDAKYPNITSAHNGNKIALRTAVGHTIIDIQQLTKHNIKYSSKLLIRAATFSQDGSLFVAEDRIAGKRKPIIYSFADQGSPVRQNIHFKGEFSYDEYIKNMTVTHDNNHLVTLYEKTITILKKQGDHWEEEHVIESPKGLIIKSTSITKDDQFLLVNFTRAPFSDVRSTPQISLYKLK